jgi:hypothetical protein
VLKLENTKPRLNTSTWKFCNFPRKSLLLESLVAVIGAIIVTYFTARNVFGQTLVFGDTPWAGNGSASILRQYLWNIWNPAAYGENSPKPQGYLLLYFFAELASFIGKDAVYSFLLHLSLPLSFISFYIYSKKFCNNLLARIFGSTLYIINPVTIAYFTAGQFMWTLVFLPLSINYFIQLLESGNAENALKASLFASLTVWTLPTIAFILGLGLTATALSYIITADKIKEYFKKLFPHLILYTLIFLLSVSPYIFSSIIYFNSPNFNLSGNVIVDFRYTYQDATILNLLRLAGNTGSPQAVFGYNSAKNLNNELGYVIPLIALLSIFWKKNHERKYRVTAVLALLCFSLLFTYSLRFICNSEISWIIAENPVFWTLRNPFKIQLLVLISIVPLFIYSLENLAAFSMKLVKVKNFKLVLLTSALTFLALSHVYFYNPFAFNGYMGVDQHPGMESAVLDQTLSSIVNDSLNWAEIGDYRGLILPFDHKSELHVEFSNMLLYPCRLGQRSRAVEILNNALTGNTKLENYMRILGIKYVYVNKMWRDTGFYITQPKNPSSILASFGDTCSLEESNNKYSKLTIEDVLPTLYVSQHPIFYSNIETINLLDKQIFEDMPVFLEMENMGCETIQDGDKNLKAFHYGLNMPFTETYNLYLVGYVESVEHLYYQVDYGELNKATFLEGKTPAVCVARLKMECGSHNLTLAVDKVDFFADLSHDFLNYGNGSYNIEGQRINVNDGTVIGTKEFESFDLTLKFKALTFGDESWHGPYIYFALKDGSYYCAIFHKNGLVELAKYSEGQFQSFMALKQTNINFQDWNNLRILKLNDTVTLYIEDQQILSLQDPILCGGGKIGLGSFHSSTLYENVEVVPNMIGGVWLIPDEKSHVEQFEILEKGSGHYSLRIHQTVGAQLLIFLGENYDPLWELKINGDKASNHMKANIYGNCWVINSPSNILNIEISYRPNMAYKYLLYISLAVEILTIAGAFFPSLILKRLGLSLKGRKPSKANGKVL